MDNVDWPGILIGGAITLIVSLFFYVPSALSLKRETGRLRRHTTLILRGLEEAGLVEYNRDDQTGEITGMVIKLSGAAVGVGSASGILTVGDEADTDAPAEQGSPETATEEPEDTSPRSAAEGT